jgi:hypoxanthine phosphoribosyltransferase
MAQQRESIARILIEADAIQARVRELGAEVAADYAGSAAPVIVVGVLRGAVVFMSDLIARSTRR